MRSYGSLQRVLKVPMSVRCMQESQETGWEVFFVLALLHFPQGSRTKCPGRSLGVMSCCYWLSTLGKLCGF